MQQKKVTSKDKVMRINETDLHRALRSIVSTMSNGQVNLTTEIIDEVINKVMKYLTREKFAVQLFRFNANTKRWELLLTEHVDEYVIVNFINAQIRTVEYFYMYKFTYKDNIYEIQTAKIYLLDEMRKDINT